MLGVSLTASVGASYEGLDTQDREGLLYKNQTICSFEIPRNMAITCPRMVTQQKSPKNHKEAP